MPIWSEVPWGTAITLVIAVYGAALSTLNFLRAGPKLRLNVRPGMVLVPSDDKRTFIQTEVTNFGDRPTTLTNIGIRYFEKPWSWEHLRNRATKAAVLNDPNPAQRFPFELKPGGFLAWTDTTGAAACRLGNKRGFVFRPLPLASHETHAEARTVLVGVS